MRLWIDELGLPTRVVLTILIIAATIAMLVWL